MIRYPNPTRQRLSDIKLYIDLNVWTSLQLRRRSTICPMSNCLPIHCCALSSFFINLSLCTTAYPSFLYIHGFLTLQCFCLSLYSSILFEISISNSFVYLSPPFTCQFFLLTYICLLSAYLSNFLFIPSLQFVCSCIHYFNFLSIQIFVHITIKPPASSSLHRLSLIDFYQISIFKSLIHSKTYNVLIILENWIILLYCFYRTIFQIQTVFLFHSLQQTTC